MKEFWVKQTDKNRFIETVHGHHISELSEPFFKMSMAPNGITFKVTKYYHYRVDITDEEYLFLKLMFDLTEEV